MHLADPILSWLQETYQNLVIDAVRDDRSYNADGRDLVVYQTIYLIPKIGVDPAMAKGRSAGNCLINARIHFYKDGSGVNLTIWSRATLTSPWAQAENREWCMADPDWINQLEQHINLYFRDRVVT